MDGTIFFKKMRKSLGNKRHEVCYDQRDEITRLYGGQVDGEHVRLFNNEDFGYRRITVERPLRLNFAADKERISRFEKTRAFTRLATSRKRKNSKAAQTEIAEGIKLQKAIISALCGLAPKGVIKNRDEFAGMMNNAFKEARINLPAASFKAILMALAERDETADICTEAKGNQEPDPELRDYENVPLKEDVDEYMKREVLPHVPDAWIDHSKTKIGYEINFNRHFYLYTPPRPLEEIEVDLKQIECEIAEMLVEVTE